MSPFFATRAMFTGGILGLVGCSNGVGTGGGLPAELLVPVQGAPLGYEGAGIAFDAARERPLLFGGAYGEALSGDTFELVDATWVKISSAGPPARALHAMAYDARREKVIVFGGRCATGCCADTWSWDGAAWMEISTPGPEARAGATMSWDARAEVLTLVGGSGCNGEPLRDLWTFDGTAWTRRWP